MYIFKYIFIFPSSSSHTLDVSLRYKLDGLTEVLPFDSGHN